jgi:ankyrin repeat protein
MSEGRRESDARRCKKATLVERMDAAFRAGDLEALRKAAGEDWGIPDGPMPMEIGPCLTYAIHRSPLPFIRELLEIGADPNPADHSGFPPLIAALWQSTRPDALAVVELLLSFGADPDQRGMNDYTPLHVAVIEGRTDAVRLLFEHGADPHLRTRIDDMESALDLAVQAGDPSLIALLEK